MAMIILTSGGTYDDYDHDGFTNDQERVNNSDLQSNTPAGTNGRDVTNPDDGLLWEPYIMLSHTLLCSKSGCRWKWKEQ